MLVCFHSVIEGTALIFRELILSVRKLYICYCPCWTVKKKNQCPTLSITLWQQNNLLISQGGTKTPKEQHAAQCARRQLAPIAPRSISCKLLHLTISTQRSWEH